MEMTKIAAIKSTKSEKVREAKRTFFVSLLDLSWRLLAAFMVPLFIGLYIDSTVGADSKTFSYIGFAVGIICFGFVFRSVIRRLQDNV